MHENWSNELFYSALGKMRPPQNMGIICIDVTNKCDLGCSNCTRLLENQDHFWEMTPDNFRIALRSLHDFPGMIAVIGGNPTMHRNFPELCKIICEEIPEKHRRGLWTNNVFKHAEIAKETFGGFNLNPHGEKRGIKSLEPLKALGVGNYYAGNSIHSPILTAVKDIFTEEKMWESISRCDVNQEWSATIIQNNGVLRAYFCEVSASFDLARGADNGIEVTDGWWKKPMEDFASQVKHFCPGCGVPARLKGHWDHQEIDTYTQTNADIAEKAAKNKRREIIKLHPNSIKFDEEVKVTDYSEEARAKALKTRSLRKKLRRLVRNLLN